MFYRTTCGSQTVMHVFLFIQEYLQCWPQLHRRTIHTTLTRVSMLFVYTRFCLTCLWVFGVPHIFLHIYESFGCHAFSHVSVGQWSAIHFLTSLSHICGLLLWLHTFSHTSMSHLVVMYPLMRLWVGGVPYIFSHLSPMSVGHWGATHSVLWVVIHSFTYLSVVEVPAFAQVCALLECHTFSYFCHISVNC